MRSFFNKPTWAATNDEPSTPDFYRRSKQTYDDIIAANRQKHQAAPTTLNLPNPSPSNPPKDHKSVKSHKRRRVTRLDDEPSDDLTNGDSSGQQTQETHSEDSVQKNTHGKSKLTSVKSPAITTLPLPPSSSSKIAINVSSSPEPTNSHDTHDVRSANEQEELTLDDKKTPDVDDPPKESRNSGDDSCAVSSQPIDQATNSNSANSQAPDENDEVVQIYITSEIKDTVPLIVHRRISQRFRDVRLVWCARQGFDSKMTSSVFLTWNKRRLFDVTTCRSLGLKNASSPIFDDVQFEGDDPSEDKLLRIHVEAVTNELLQSKANSALQHSYSKPDKSQAATEPSFSIALRSRDHDEVWIKVRKRTKVSQIINEFRARTGLSGDVNMQLSFDGDVLDPSSRLEAHDIAEDDLIEVLIK